MAVVDFKTVEEMTLGDLQISASRILCLIGMKHGEDALKVLTLQMIAAGGNNRKAIDAMGVHWRKLTHR